MIAEPPDAQVCIVIAQRPDTQHGLVCPERPDAQPRGARTAQKPNAAFCTSSSTT